MGSPSALSTFDFCEGAGVAFGVTMATSALASTDPTVDQIHTAAANGHLDQAQQMIAQVLAGHPDSAKAHFVQSELFARQGKAALARAELATAEQLKPGLPFENPRAVQQLKAQLGLESRVTTPRLPWGTLLLLAGVVAVLWMVFRRRPANRYPAGTGPSVGGAAGAYGPGPMGGGGIGSGIAGGLASGLAVGAGVVAGEELAHHFLDGGRGGGVIPVAEAGESGFGNNNGDMGGADFGVNDPGSGWDDGGGSIGGDDWS